MFGWMSPHCSHSSRHAVANVFAHCPHLLRTMQAPVFAQGLAPSVAHSCWTHVRKQAVPTAFRTFFELASSSSKNVAAGRQADRFGGQRQLGTRQMKAASRSGIKLNPRCGHGPVCRHARQGVATWLGLADCSAGRQSGGTASSWHGPIEVGSNDVPMLHAARSGKEWLVAGQECTITSQECAGGV